MDYGAEVIQVASLTGDSTRRIGPSRHSMGPPFLDLHRNKCSIVLSGHLYGHTFESANDD